MKLLDKMKNAWNAFIGQDPPNLPYYEPTINYGYSSTYNPAQPTMHYRNERSIINAVYSRISVDCAAVSIRHAKLDDNGRFTEIVNSDLNERLTVEANKDQTPRQFMIDIIISLFDEGYVAIVPIDTSDNILETNTYNILSWRVGKVTQWYPDHVRVECYDDRSGYRREITLPKADVAIVENPFYHIMNEPNSTLRRLTEKLALLDYVDKQSGKGKLDLIVQLPYLIKTEARKKQAEERRQMIVDQLTNSDYGIAYTDGTEKITQLNRPVENNILTQVTYLTEQLFAQLGITQEILNGTANEQTMINYNNRVIEPLISAITDEMNRKFLTKTARTQHQAIVSFKEPFKLVPVSMLADIADKFTRNEIMSSNEIRQIIGLKPIDDPAADELRNKNLNETNNTDYAYTQDEYPDESESNYEYEEDHNSNYEEDT